MGDEKIADQFEELMSKAREFEQHAPIRSRGEQYLDEEVFCMWGIQALKLVEVVAGVSSQDYSIIKAYYDRAVQGYGLDLCIVVRSTFEGIYKNYMSGWFNVPGRIRADVTDDFMEYARHLREENKGQEISSSDVAAAVLAGAALESTLRYLCVKHDVAIYNENDKPRKASILNTDLKDKAYNKAKWNRINGWLQTRNSAAHGDIEKLTLNDIDELLKGVEDFNEEFLS